jgi:hypothetical protein
MGLGATVLAEDEQLRAELKAGVPRRHGDGRVGRHAEAVAFARGPLAWAERASSGD